jgi:hypothetical protein
MNRNLRSFIMLALLMVGLISLVGVTQQVRAQDQTQEQEDNDQDTNDDTGEQDEGDTDDDQDSATEDDANDDQEAYAPTIDPANFVAVIDNPYFPLTPGTVFIYEGQTDQGIEHIEVTVTSETKQILGVTCVVVRDIVTVDGKLEEDTYDWYAQDKDGNVWYFGEDTKKYEADGTVSTEGSFEAGVDAAMPGILMKGNPQVGEVYHEEYYQGHAEDEAEIVSVGESVTVPYGSFNEVLMTKNTTPLEPDLLENKYYAKGIGSVLEIDVSGGSGQVELIEIKK